MHLESHHSLRNGLEAVVAAGTSCFSDLGEQAVRNGRKNQMPLALCHENLTGPLSANFLDIASRVSWTPMYHSAFQIFQHLRIFIARSDGISFVILPCPGCLFEHSFLGRLPNAVYVWRIIDGKDKQSQTVVDRLSIPERASRQFSKNFTNIASRLKITGLPSQLKKLLHATMQVASEEYSAGLERLDWLLQLDEEDRKVGAFLEACGGTAGAA